MGFQLTNIEIKKNIPLKNFTTFKVGGEAKYFCDASSIEDIKEALNFARQENLPILILSGGSNLIVNDKGFDGLVIKIDFRDIVFNANIIEVGSGFIMNELVNISIDNGLAGLEWAGGLPGEVGGATRGNAGAFSGEMKDVVEEVTSLTREGQLIVRSREECNFGYRTSIFKTNGEIIIKVKLKFAPGNPQILKEIAESHREYRRKRHPIEYPSAGSIFKNVPVSNASDAVVEKFKNVIKKDPFPVIPTAAILSQLEIAGYQVGGAQISMKHPNYIVNINNATAADIVSVIQYAIAKVMEEYEIKLEVEPQLVGFSQHFSWESL
jgi:UDP-N-acetylmuramate dehydrogenase